MGLGHDGEVIVGDALNDIGLPQRMLAVEQLGVDAGDELPELGGRSGRGKGGAPDVIIEIEGCVIHPNRVGHAPGDTADALPQSGIGRQARTDALNDIGRVEAGGPLEDEHLADMHRGVAPLQGQEGGIQGG